MVRTAFFKILLGTIGVAALGLNSFKAYADTDPDPIVVTSCESFSGIDKIICLADAFKAQLSASQIATLQLSYSMTDARKWSNFPQSLLPQSLRRVGLNFGSLTETQIAYAKALVKELAGSTIENEGWFEIQQILNADNYLETVNPNGGYGSDNYYISFLGTPAAVGKFAILFGGHHLAFQNTYVDGQLAGATPSFRGVEPTGTFTFNGTTNQPLNQEHAAILAVLNSLSTSELNTAHLSPSVTNLVAGPQQDNNIPTTYSGIQLSNLTTEQQNLVFEVIKTYVHDIAEYNTFLTTYQNELNETYISYSGNTSLSFQGDYFRIHGPSVWIEWAVQPAIALDEPHIHSVWRDKNKDYGANFVPTVINDMAAVKTVSVYPNPAIEEINVTLPEEVSNATITITDISGKIVHRNSFTGNKVNVDVNAFSKGVYFLNIQYKTDVYGSKFFLE